MTKDFDKFKNHGKDLTFKFESKEAANHFKSWLCGSGEQQYWDWMEYREQEETEDDITALSFDYHTDDSTVIAKCGRLDKEE